MKTFKELQDDVLVWTVDDGDTTTMRNIVKQSIDKLQRKILTSEQLDFMLSPAARTLSVVAGTKVYRLPDDWFQGLYVYRPDTATYYEEIAPKGLLEADEGYRENEDFDVQRYMISFRQNIMNQPAAAGTIVVDTTGGSEAAANGVVVQGLDATGNWIEEALSSGSTWTQLTSVGSFATVTNIIKTGATWTRTITVTRGAVTVTTLTSAQFAKQFQTLEFVKTPQSAVTLEYRYYKRPIPLVYDYQTPEIPEEFTDMLHYGTLRSLTGFTKPEQTELDFWNAEYSRLDNQMKQAYQQGRTITARPRRIHMNPRY